MTITWANRFEGGVGTQPTSTSLDETGDAPSAISNDQLLYDDTYQLRSRDTIRFRTWYSRTTSSFVRIPKPSGAWSLRFYLHTDDWNDPDPTLEYRTLLALGSRSIAYRETGAGNTVLRLIDPTNLGATADSGTGGDQGSPVDFAIDQRIEISYDGAGTLTGRIFAGDSLSGERFNTWSYTPTSSSLTLMAYRWHQYPLLQQGDTDASTGGLVTPWQEKLNDWLSSPILVDGDYGPGTAGATETVQQTYDLVVDGQAGPETQSALDLAILQGATEADPFPSPPPSADANFPFPVWMGAVAVTDQAEVIGPLDPASVDLVSLTAQASLPVVVDVPPHVDLLAAADLAVTVSSQRDTTVSLTAAADIDVVPAKSVAVGSVPMEVLAALNLQITTTVTIPPPPPQPPTFRILIYDPAGNLRGQLPFPLSWEASIPLNDIGAFSFTYSEHAPGFDLLDEPFELALTLNRGGGSVYEEPADCRFILLRRSWDLVDRTRVVRYTLASYGWMLRKARIPVPNVGNTDPALEELTFTNRRPPSICRLLLEDAKAREALRELGTVGFSVTDSAGQTWDHDPIDEIVFQTGTDILNIVQTFSEDQYFDWTFHQRDLKLYNPDTSTGLGRRLEEVVHIENYSNSTEANDERAFDETAFLVYGRSSLVGDSEPATIYPGWWGRWEEFVNISGDLKQPVVGDILRAHAAETGRLNNTQSLRRFPVLAHQPVPLLDYRPGDWVSMHNIYDPFVISQGFRTTRVQQVTLNFDTDRVVKATVTLDRRFSYREQQDHRRLERLTNRSVIRGTGVR